MNIFALSGLINAVTWFTMGFFVFSRGKKNPRNITFAIYCFTLTIWSAFYFLWLTAGDAYWALFFSRALMAGAAFIPTCYLHHILTFFGLVKEKRNILTLCYIFSFLFLGLVFTPFFVKGVSQKLFFSFWPDPGIAFHFFLPIWISIVLYGLFLNVQFFFRSRGARRNQIKYILVGGIIAWGGGATNFFLWYDIPIPPYGNFLILIYAFLTAYAIIAARLMQIEIVAKKFVYLTGMFIVSIAAGHLAFYAGSSRLGMDIGRAYLLATIVSMVIFSTFLWQVYNRVFRKEEMVLEMLRNSALEMVAIPDPVKLAREICIHIDNTFRPVFTDVYLIEDRKDPIYILRASKGKSKKGKESRLDKNNPVIKWFMEKKKELWDRKLLREEFENVLTVEQIDTWLEDAELCLSIEEYIPFLKELRRELISSDAAMVIASFYRRTLYGLLIVGEKDRGTRFYEKQDLKLLSTLAAVSAMNVKNAITIHEKHIEIRKKSALIEQVKRMAVQMILSLNKAIEAKDPYTGRHSEDVRSISKWIVEGAGLEWTESLDYSSQLHDIGKIGIPDSVLGKKGALTKEEYEIIKEHPKIGTEILSMVDFFSNVAQIVYCHQEHYDGSGYPAGLKGSDIPLEARIIAVADAYHAMVSDRPYRRALSLKEAVRELVRMKGKQFDPDIVDILVRKLIKIYSVSGELSGDMLKDIYREEGK
ncbi:HD domain-containing phosphohydrolase [Candidatus Omnitrophota bacterium]